jgi:hypothetical protein
MQVAPGVLKPAPAPRVALALLQLVDPAEGASRGTARLSGRQAAGEVLLGLELEMQGHLLGHFAPELGTSEEGKEATKEVHLFTGGRWGGGGRRSLLAKGT